MRLNQGKIFFFFYPPGVSKHFKYFILSVLQIIRQVSAGMQHERDSSRYSPASPRASALSPKHVH